MITCPKCGKEILAPRLRRDATGVVFRMNCPECGRRFSIPIQKSAQVIPCPYCLEPMTAAKIAEVDEDDSRLIMPMLVRKPNGD